jgi:hypothetical protein
MESFQSPISADTSFLPDPFATQFTPPNYLGHPAVPDVHPPAPPNPGLHPPAPPPNPGLPSAPLPVPPSAPPVQPQVSTLLQAPTIATNQFLQGQQALQTILSDFASMTTVFVQAQANGPPRSNQGSGTNGRPPGTYANTFQAMAVLNCMGLPNDVHRRYDTRDKPLTPSRVLPFTNGDCFYHNQAIGTGKFLSIVITGHVLFHDYQSKSFQKAAPKCLT